MNRAWDLYCRMISKGGVSDEVDRVRTARRAIEAAETFESIESGAAEEDLTPEDEAKPKLVAEEG